MKRELTRCMFCGAVIQVKWNLPPTMLGRACPRHQIMPTPETDPARARALHELREMP